MLINKQMIIIREPAIQNVSIQRCGYFAFEEITKKKSKTHTKRIMGSSLGII